MEDEDDPEAIYVHSPDLKWQKSGNRRKNDSQSKNEGDLYDLNYYRNRGGGKQDSTEPDE